MPSTYAHFRFGQDVLRELADKERQIIEANEELYRIGLHGPDILFYYRPLMPNKINQIGYRTHEKAGEAFFSNAAKELKQHNMDEKQLAYIYGFICHFALDVSCHGYIEKKIKNSGVSHTEIEVEFDRALMILDGFDPLRHQLTDHIVPSMQNAEVIQNFFGGVTQKHIRQALKRMIFDNHLLVAPGKIKRFFIYSVMRMTGNYKEMHGLLVNFEENPVCKDSTEKLFALYDKAKELAVRLIEEYIGYVQGMQILDEIYQYDFSFRPVKKKTYTTAQIVLK